MSARSSGACSNPAAGRVLDFWLGDPADAANIESRERLWFGASPRQDAMLRRRFATLHGRARGGELDHWAGAPRDLLALVVLLDQFSRNLYRATSLAFASDAKSLALARAALQRGFDEPLQVAERAFLYMPFQHSESRVDQRRSVRLYRALRDSSPAELAKFAGNQYQHAVLHCEIVERFGRFPHRNAVLGRPSTRAEAGYLDGGGQRFGQG